MGVKIKNMANNKNFSQHWEGFPDVDYEWGQDDVYFNGFVNTHVQDKMEAEYYTNFEAEDNDAENDNTQIDPTRKGIDMKKTGAWITRFLTGTGLYRPIPTYNPAGSPTSTTQYQGAPLYGCMNPNALNFNPMANTDDGSCQLRRGLLSPLAWGGIGVGALLLIIGIIAIAGGGDKSSAPKRRVVDLNDPAYK